MNSVTGGSRAPGSVTIDVGPQRFAARVIEWTQSRVAIQPLAERRLWGHRMVPGAELEMGWAEGAAWTSGTSRVVRWLTAYAVELEPPWSVEARQRRLSPRVPCAWPVTVTWFGPAGPVTRPAQGIDVSATGMAVRVSGEYRADTRVALTVQTPGDLPVIAVAHVIGYDNQDRNLRLRFLYLTPEDERWLHRLLELLTTHRAA